MCPHCQQRESSRYRDGSCDACYRRNYRQTHDEQRQRDLESSREWKRRNKQHTKQYDAIYRESHRKQCPTCGGEMGMHATVGCRACVEKQWDARRDQMVMLYKSGMKVADIASELGTTVNSLNVQLVRLRKHGLIGRRRG